MIFDNWWFQLPCGIGMFFFLYFTGKGLGSYLLLKGQAFKTYMEKAE